MESFLNRYRNITVLLLVIFAQLVLLAVQVKNDQDVHLIRVWTVTAVTPFARLLEGMRGGGIGFVRNYILLHDADAANRRLQAEVDRLKVENIFLKNEVNSADRAKALQLFQLHTPSKMLAATIILTGAGSNSKVVFVDRGSVEGVMRGMAVVTPDGIVGKVIAAYPTASAVLLVTDPDFAAGVVSQKSGARGTFKGQGNPLGKVDYVPFEEKVAQGEWFYTSGDDRVFPRGFPVGQAKAVRPGQPFQEILVDPAGLQRGLEDVLIVMAGVHQDIPDTPPVNQPVYIAPPPPAPSVASVGPGGAGAPADVPAGVPLAPGGTEADKLRQQYKALGDAQKHKFGEGEPGTLPPDFKKLGQAPPAGVNKAPPGTAGQPAVPASASGATGTPAKSPAVAPGGSGAAPGAVPGATPRQPADLAPGVNRVPVSGGQPAGPASASGATGTPAKSPAAAPGGSGSAPGSAPSGIPKRLADPTPGVNKAPSSVGQPAGSATAPGATGTPTKSPAVAPGGSGAAPSAAPSGIPKRLADPAPGVNKTPASGGQPPGPAGAPGAAGTPARSPAVTPGGSGAAPGAVPVATPKRPADPPPGVNKAPASGGQPAGPAGARGATGPPVKSPAVTPGGSGSAPTAPSKTPAKRPADPDKKGPAPGPSPTSPAPSPPAAKGAAHE